MVACETRHIKTDGNEQSNRLSDDIDPAFLRLAGDVLTACQSYWIGVYRYTNEFMLPYWTALNAFQTTESDKLVRHHPIESLKDYLELFKFNLQVAEKGMVSSLTGMNDYHTATATRAYNALLNSTSKFKASIAACIFVRSFSNCSSMLSVTTYSVISAFSRDSCDALYVMTFSIVR